MLTKNSKAYITGAGKFLPGKPVSNEEMENFIGTINGNHSRLKEHMLKQNGILSRYYALDSDQQPTTSVAGMIAEAIKDCIGHTSININEIDFLAAASTQPDIPVPGLASMVHGELRNSACEIVSINSICSSGMMAIKSAMLQVNSDGKKNSVASAGEFASRFFKSKRFSDHERISMDIEFLRWMLSDGAGALLIQPEPSLLKHSLEIEWIDIRSYAHLFEVCMYAGSKKNGDGTIQKSWLDYDNFTMADEDGAIYLRQDARLVDNVVMLGVQRFFELVDEGKINPSAIDHLLCHYSSHHFKSAIRTLMEKGGCVIPEEKWFSNLYSKGNTGAASIFIMLEELLNEKSLKAGERILCMVPESGRFITSFMLLTVHEPVKDHAKKYFTAIRPPEIKGAVNPVQEWLVRQLTSVWINFETSLNQVPIVDKINRGVLPVAEYKLLLLNLRQQVIDGSQWIARAASNVSMDYFEVRSSFITHSRDEHRDYQLLEKNYLNLGGTLEEIKTGEKNIGSEALSAFMFFRASQPNPFDLLGGMFIIEGLGNRLAGKWGRAIKEQLDLQDDQVSFLLYHESSDADDNHFERFEKAIQSDLLTADIAKRIVKTAKTVAKLYVMQLQEIGNY